MEFNKANMQQAAEEMMSASPEELKAQAAEMRRNPGTIRASVPAMAGMTDAQIGAAADNIDRMADNAELRAQTAQKVQSMEDADVSRFTSALPPAAAPPSVGGFSFGDRVRVRGLVGMPQHNGRLGVCGPPHAGDEPRVCVRLDGESTQLALQPNMTVTSSWLTKKSHSLHVCYL